MEKSTEETKGRPGISDSGTGCEVQDWRLGEGQWLWRCHFRVGKDRTPISGTKEQVKRQEDRDQSQLSQAHACQTGSRGPSLWRGEPGMWKKGKTRRSGIQVQKELKNAPHVSHHISLFCEKTFWPISVSCGGTKGAVDMKWYKVVSL